MRCINIMDKYIFSTLKNVTEYVDMHYKIVYYLICYIKLYKKRGYVMKKIKSGFTLAEVLITLSIIGIIAAIVMPSVISSYQYKTVGVKLSKFVSTVEDASRAYVVQNDSFKTNTDAIDFVNEAFLIKSLEGVQDVKLLQAYFGADATIAEHPTFYTIDSTEASTDIKDYQTQTGLIGTLKDNTSISVQMVKKEEYTTHKGIVDSHKVGLPVFNINFNPHANGLPSTVQKNFNFVVTELGYVFPSDSDDCLWDIYEKDWSTNAKTFNSGSACNLTNGTKKD